MTAVCPACVGLPEDTAREAVAANITLSLPTLHCAACIGKVERALNARSDVLHARVNLSRKRVAIAAPRAEAATMIAALGAIGYEAHALDAAVLAKSIDARSRDLLIRLSVAGFAMMNVMLLSVAVWSGAAGATRDLFHLISAGIALPAVLYSAQPFFQSAWTALRVRSLNMDVPISLAIVLAAGMSLFEALSSGAHAYFDAALSLTFFLLIGRFLDHKTRAAARSAAKELAALEVHTAQRFVDGIAVQTRVSELCVADEILVPTGGRVPVDGVLLAGSAMLDRSFLTGEAASIMAASGDAVQAGEVNLGAPFMLRATAVGEDTTLRRIAAMVEMAEGSRNSYTALADRAAQIYAPLVHLLAFAAFLGWVVLAGDVRFALNVAVAVLIITCPCALGLAVPAVATAAIGRLYGQGFLVKSGTALERLAEVDTIIFDKTGTLTLPDAKLSMQGFSDREKAVALGLAQQSGHPIAKAIAAAAADVTPAPLQGVTEVPGKGVTAQMGETLVRLGNGHWIGADDDEVALQIGDAPPLRFRMTETLRDGAAEAVAAVQAQGYDVIIVSGDRAARVRNIAGKLGVAQIHAQVSAEGKHDILSDLTARGRKVLMVGDGLNDAAVLSAAHASIAPSSALDASRNCADIIMLRDGFGDLPLVLSVAKAATRLSKQNFAIAAGYNVIAVPIALAGFATPLLAALAMSTSSITVLVNALRVRWVK